MACCLLGSMPTVSSPCFGCSGGEWRISYTGMTSKRGAFKESQGLAWKGVLNVLQEFLHDMGSDQEERTKDTIDRNLPREAEIPGAEI